jgi:hypothetical protein
LNRLAFRRLWFGALLLGNAFGLIGCARLSPDQDALTIATTWSSADRSEVETAFGHWLSTGTSATPVKESARIAWLPLKPEDDPPTVILQPGRHKRGEKSVDVVLGGPASSYARLAEADALVPIDRPGAPRWCVARRQPIGLATGPKIDTSTASMVRVPWPSDRVTFDDPRHDPITLQWAKGQLAANGWAEGYAQLVRNADHPRRIGRRARSALAAVERGEANMTPAIAPELTGLRTALAFVPSTDSPEWIEGVAIVRGGSHVALAQLFLQFLAERQQAGPPPDQRSTESDALLADLLGATLVDAQDELWDAWVMLEQTGHPAQAEMWMTQAPPWPPASVEKLLEQDRSGALLQTLADEIAPDADIRAWLVRSWLAPRRLIDGPVLEELCEAVGGRLVREPRFRAWLRAEWTAWARQRYRRVARKAGGWTP